MVPLDTGTITVHDVIVHCTVVPEKMVYLKMFVHISFTTKKSVN